MRSQISRVHLKITPCGRTGALTSRLWEIELLLLGTSLTLIREAGHSYYLTFGPEAVGEKHVWRVFQGTVPFREAQRAGGSWMPSWLFKEELPCLVREGWGQDRLWRSSWAAGHNTALAHSLLWWRFLALRLSVLHHMWPQKACVPPELAWEDGGGAGLSSGAPAVPSLPWDLINTPRLPPPSCPFSTAESRHKGTLSSWHIPLLINVMQCSHNNNTMSAM